MNVLDEVAPAAGQVHALVVGTSVYPAADPDSDDPNAKQYGVEALTSAARSASEFAAWLVEDYSRRDELASLRVLLSPSDGEEIHPTIGPRLPAGGAPATSAGFKADFREFQRACKFPESTAIVYLAGHGVQVSIRSATVLLQDYLADPHDDILAAAIDVMQCHRALDGDDSAQTQFWFVDACRQKAEAAKRFEVLGPGWAPRDEPRGFARVSPIFLAASPREQAFAEIGGTSLFNQALAWILDGHVANEPSALCDRWHVNTGSLINNLAPRVKELAAAHRTQQLVDVTGHPNPGVLHEYLDRPAARLGRGDASVGAGVADPVAAVGIGVADTAYISIEFDVSSYKLGTLMPWSITAPGRLVDSGFGSDTVPVPPGEYVVACVLPDGSKPTKTIEVAAGQTEPARFEHRRPESAPFESVATPDAEDDGDEADAGEASDDEFLGLDDGAWDDAGPSSPDTGDRAGDDWASDDAIFVETPPRRRPRPRPSRPRPASPVREPRQRVRLVSVDEAEVATIALGDVVTWAFQPDDDLDVVPVARIVTAAERQLDVSLPVNPRSGYPTNSCTITTGGEHDLQIRFAPERLVASTLATFLDNDELGTSSELFDEAAHALLGKYSDPAGAVLGGLTLHRLGRLREKAGWVENLARDFDWLPDGSILLAALLQHDEDPDERARGLAGLLTATAKRPMYTDGLALAVDLLRRWDDDASRDARGARLATLGALLADADHSQIFLATTAD